MIDKGTYKIIKGDVTNPIGEGIKIIPHIISDLGVCGAGVAKAIVEKWPSIKEDLSSMKLRGSISLGKCFYSSPKDGIIVASMIAQKGLRSSRNLCPIKYAAVIDCMKQVQESFSKTWSESGEDIRVSIHCPKFGSCLAGGNWDFIEILIKEIWVDAGINVFVYEL